MSGSALPVTPSPAIFADDKSVSESSQPSLLSGENDTSVGWFAEIALGIIGDCKPGAVLHHLTGFEDRSCQRYAAGTVQPSGYFLRALLRSPQGAQWLAALMEGCDAPWWSEHQRNMRLAAAAERFKREID